MSPLGVDQLPPQRPKPYHRAIALALAFGSEDVDVVMVCDYIGVGYARTGRIDTTTRQLIGTAPGFQAFHRAGFALGQRFTTMYEALSFANCLSYRAPAFDWSRLGRRRDNYPVGPIDEAGAYVRASFALWRGLSTTFPA